MLCTSLFVVQFSMTVRYPSRDSLTIIPHRFPLVNTFFEKILNIFSGLVIDRFCGAPLADSLTILPYPSPIVKGVFEFF